MKRKTAESNIIFAGWVLIIVGSLALLGTIIYWQGKSISDLVMDSLFGIAMIYLGSLILYSIKTIKFYRKN